MTERQDSSHPIHPKRPLLFGEPGSLLESLLTLYWRVRAMLLEGRLRQAQEAAGLPRKPEIQAALGHYIGRTVSERQDPEPAGSGEMERRAALASREKPAEARRQGEVAVAAPSIVLSEFAKYLRRRSRSATVRPPLAEKLQQRTWEHVASAVKLARWGKEDGARLHASLAENAMTEASRYMAQAEYDAFEKGVKEKLGTIAGQD
jgi:hypothetical protein